MIADGRFRLDLLYRLNTFTIRLPALRERATVRPARTDRLVRPVRLPGVETRPSDRSTGDALAFRVIPLARQRSRTSECGAIRTGPCRQRRADLRLPACLNSREAFECD